MKRKRIDNPIIKKLPDIAEETFLQWNHLLKIDRNQIHVNVTLDFVIFELENLLNKNNKKWEKR